MFRKMHPVLRAAVFLAVSFVLLIGVNCLMKLAKGEPVEINWITCAGGAVLVTAVQFLLTPERFRRRKGPEHPEDPGQPGPDQKNGE